MNRSKVPSSSKRRLAAAALAAGAALLAGSGAQADSAGSEWTTAAGVSQGTRFSSLKEVTPANVAGLTEEFAFSTGVKASHEGAPLVVGDTMYVLTPFPNRLYALDLKKPGTVKWQYSPSVNGFAHGVACCDTVNRGAAYAEGKVVFNTLDNTVVAVDGTTGKLLWRTSMGDPRTGLTLTMSPLIVRKTVIIGNAGGEMGVRGWVAGLNLDTGKVTWKAYATGPDADVKIGSLFHPFYAKDKGTDLGTSTWPGTLWKQGGATSWGWITYDPKLDLIYYGTANPGVWNPDMRLGDNKWGSTIFARYPDTGDAVWAYQLTPHDGWDYDAVNESIVAELQIGGRQRKVIVHFNKNGFAYTLDRKTGEILVAEPFGEVTWASSVSKTTGMPAINPAMQPHQGEITQGVCPSPLGVKDWQPAAFSPKTKLFYVPTENLCDNIEPLKAVYIAGTPFMGADIAIYPGTGGYLGRLVAWDAATGHQAWAINEPLPVYAGVLATAGDLIFYGTLDGWFKAANATTGAVVFQKKLECGIVGNPISYQAPDGHQRIAIYAGVGWLAGGFAGGTCYGTAAHGAGAGGVLHVFKLP